jgi:hypothetical protein
VFWPRFVPGRERLRRVFHPRSVDVPARLTLNGSTEHRVSLNVLCGRLTRVLSANLDRFASERFRRVLRFLQRCEPMTSIPRPFSAKSVGRPRRTLAQPPGGIPQPSVDSRQPLVQAYATPHHLRSMFVDDWESPDVRSWNGVRRPALTWVSILAGGRDEEGLRIPSARGRVP